MANLQKLEQLMAVAPIKLIIPPCAEKLGSSVNRYLIEFRQDLHNKFKADPAFQGYIKDNYIARIDLPRFGSGESKCTLLDSIRGDDIFIITDVTNHSLTYKMQGFENHYSPDDHFQDLKRILAAIDGKAHRINVIMPFLYEGRQHKRSGRESLDAAYMFKELSNMGITNFITFDAHDPRIQNSAPFTGFDNFNAMYQFARTLLSNERDMIIDKDHTIIISPDEGALDRSIYFASVLGLDAGMFYKRRDYTKMVNGKNPIVAHEFLGDNIDGKDCIIIDDMISSGGSMIDTARQLKEMNAKRVYICTTFGLFTDGLAAFDEAYEKCYFDKIVTTNLNYIDPDLYTRPYYLQADMGKFIASIIDFMNHDAPMSDLNTPTEKIRKILDRYNNREEFTF